MALEIPVVITYRVVARHTLSCKWLNEPRRREFSPWREAGIVELTADGRRLWEVPRRQPLLFGDDAEAVKVNGWLWWRFRCIYLARARRACAGELVVRPDGITEAFLDVAASRLRAPGVP